MVCGLALHFGTAYPCIHRETVAPEFISPVDLLPAHSKFHDLTSLHQYPTHQDQQSYQGFPTLAQFNAMVNNYLGLLSVKKQGKALLTQ